MHVDKGIIDLESKIGTKSGFFLSLLSEDDWSFVIKLHALFEAVCTHLLLFHFKEPDLSELFGRLELSNKTTGKIAFLAKLKMLGKNDRRLVASLSELRNSLVHDVRNSKFMLTELVGSLTDKELKRFAISFSPFESHIRRMVDAPLFPDSMPDEKLIMQADINNVIKRAKDNPKEHIWLGAHHTLVSLVDMYGYSDYKQWVKAKELFDEEHE